MTPRNSLDEKVIVDRPLLKTIRAILRTIDQCPKTLAMVNETLDQDLTGWAAVPILSTIQMDCAGANNVFDNLSRASETWSTMLAASPALEQCKIPEEVK